MFEIDYKGNLSEDIHKATADIDLMDIFFKYLKKNLPIYLVITILIGIISTITSLFGTPKPLFDSAYVYIICLADSLYDAFIKSEFMRKRRRKAIRNLGELCDEINDVRVESIVDDAEATPGIICISDIAEAKKISIDVLLSSTDKEFIETYDDYYKKVINYYMSQDSNGKLFVLKEIRETIKALDDRDSKTQVQFLEQKDIKSDEELRKLLVLKEVD